MKSVLKVIAIISVIGFVIYLVKHRIDKRNAWLCE